MSPFGPRFIGIRRLRLVQTALWIMLPGVVAPIFFAPASAAEKEAPVVRASASATGPDVYTINFNNVSVIEYIRFVSKITGSNFVFDENDLQFAVTIVSEEPATLEDIFSALVQVLRINDLNLLEHEGNFVISRNPSVQQMPPVMTEDVEEKSGIPTIPIVTRVFRIKNTNVNSLAAIIKPMVSQRAIVSVSNETKQLIVSDIVTNIDEIARLLANLDSAHSPLDVDDYVAQHISPGELVGLAREVLLPFAEGNPLIFVPQLSTNTIFIVSTPHLIERALAILHDLDTPPASDQLGAILMPDSLFPYKPLNRSTKELLASLQKITEQLKSAGHAPPMLLAMLSTAREIKDADMVLFVGDKITYNNISEILAILDVPNLMHRQNFFIYRVLNVSVHQLKESIQQLIHTFKQTKAIDPQVIAALESAKHLSETNSLIFTADEVSLSTIQTLIPTLDLPPTSLGTQFYMYKLKSDNLAQLQNALKEFANTLRTSSTSDQPLLEGIESAKYIPENHSLIFTGDKTTLMRIQELLPTLDPEGEIEGQVTFYMYPIKIGDYKALQTVLAQFSEQLKNKRVPDQRLITAIESLRYIRETNSFLFTGTKDALARLQILLPSLDQQALNTQKAQSLFIIYQLKYLSFPLFQEELKTLSVKISAAPMPDQDLLASIKSIAYLKETNSVVFSGSPSTIARINELLPTIDISPTAPPSQGGVYLYQLKNVTEPQFQQALVQLITQLKNTSTPDTNLIQLLSSAHYIKESNSIVFTGAESAFVRLREIILQLDTEGAVQMQSTYFIYTPKQSTEADFEQALQKFVSNLKRAPSPDQALITALESRKFLPESQSFTFNGIPSAIAQVQKVLLTLDVVPPTTESSFYIYKLQNAKEDSLETSLNQFVTNLLSSSRPDQSLIAAIRSRRFIAQTNSFVFTGEQSALDRLRTLLPSLDVSGDQFYIYTPQYRKGESLLKALLEMSKNLRSSGLADVALLRTIESAKWVPSSGGIVFTGDNNSIQQIKLLMPTLDTQAQSSQTEEASVYFLYKLQYADPQETLAYLESINTNLNADEPNRTVKSVISSAKIIPDNNAILLTGSKNAVEDAKILIAQYDTPEHRAPTVSLNNFFIFKPKNQSPQDVMAAVRSLVNELSAAGNIDPNLQKSAKDIRYIEANQSLVISGSDKTIAQMRTLLEEVDVAGGKNMQQVGALTFFIYKLQYVTPERLMLSLQSVAKELEKGGLEDQALATTIRGMKTISETNSVLFTGTSEALAKVQELLPKFDNASLGPPPAEPENPAGYVIYRPLHKPGDELIQMLCDFVDHLRQTGISPPSLIHTVNNLRWIENTCSLLITGDQEAIAKVQGLLKQFDIPSGDSAVTTATLGETGFLIYKLQYHQGDDIQRALRRVAADLADANKGQKIPIAEAIESLQWIPVTNSLLTSGAPSVLSRIRDLIQNLDIPLRQVFIEVLVLQTSLNNSQSFGLSWAGRAQYKNQVAGQISNFNPPQADNLIPPFKPLSATVTPNASNFTTPAGFDLGVIGDIILHKGKTFFSLGSLVNALETDLDSTIVMNPKIIAQDSNNATMFFGFNIPFTGSLVTTNATSITTSASVEYRNVGHNLSITPTLGSGDLITLDISEELSQVVGQSINSVATTSSTAVTGLTTSQTNMSTRVHVPDGHFVCLTGQINETKSHTRQQIPCLGGLPLIGAAFANDNRVNERDNIIIFLRPQIIKTFDEYKKISENQQALFLDRASLPVMKEAIDEGIDMVKMPDNE